MKKLYILAAAAMLAAGAQAKQLTFFVNQTEEVTPGTTVINNNQDVWDDGATLDVTLDPKVYLMSDEDASGVTVTATCTNGYSIQLCAGGNCESGTSVTKTTDLKGGEKLNLRLDWINSLWPADQPIPTIEIDVEAYYAGEAANKTAFHLILNQTEGSVNVIGMDSNTVSVSNGQILVNGSSDVEVYSLDGRRVANSSLDKGVYVAGGKKVLVK